MSATLMVEWRYFELAIELLERIPELIRLPDGQLD